MDFSNLCRISLHMPLCVVCARHLYSNQHISIHGPQSPEQQAVDCRVEAPVEALGVLSLSSCSAHAERVACVVCTRGAHSRRSRGAHAALTRRSLGPARVGDGDVRAGLGRPGVEEDGDDDERGAAPEAVVRGEVEEGHGGEARQKDRKRLGVCDLGAISSPLREVEIAPRSPTPRDASSGRIAR